MIKRSLHTTSLVFLALALVLSQACASGTPDGNLTEESQQDAGIVDISEQIQDSAFPEDTNPNEDTTLAVDTATDMASDTITTVPDAIADTASTVDTHTEDVRMDAAEETTEPGPTCTDNQHNGDETDIDCGGLNCPLCLIGAACEVDLDCDTQVCAQERCSAPTCDDRIQNGDETGLDCGGPLCAACGVGQGCTVGEDCDTGHCRDNICQQREPTCIDNERNGEETGTDCGGPTCPRCPNNVACLLSEDCLSWVCIDNVCALPTCDDRVFNGQETGLDCGGPLCGACPDMEGCTDAEDCISHVCNNDRRCAAPSCSDQQRNGTETGQDCGGAVCEPCATDEPCTINEDCASRRCDIGHTDLCVDATTPTCADNERNGEETDIDCGGRCRRCVVGEQCEVGSDCATGICDFFETQHCIEAEPQFLTDEDFETGDLSRFDYTVSGPEPWHVVNDQDGCFSGNFCLRSSPLHGGGEQTSIGLNLWVRSDTLVAFWVKLELESPDDAEPYALQFYLDDVEVGRWSGVEGWQRVEFPIAASEPGGQPRSLRWEYTRSSWLPTDRPVRNAVWIDAIDMPDWNTEPSIPEQLTPGNNTVTPETTPTFAWRAFDPDFDALLYVMELSTTADFSSGVVRVPESTESRWVPTTPLEEGVDYYWRTRAKDVSSFRWTGWSPVWTLRVESSLQRAVWRQDTTTQFLANTRTNVGVVEPSAMETSPTLISVGGDRQDAYPSAHWTHTELPPALPDEPGHLLIRSCGDYLRTGWGPTFAVWAIPDNPLQSDFLERIEPLSRCRLRSHTVTVPNIAQYVNNDGMMAYRLAPSNNSSHFVCNDEEDCNFFEVTLQYNTYTSGTAVTSPIVFNALRTNDADHWETLVWSGAGDVRVHVLDAEGDLLPDNIVPGNSDGLTQRTIMLWDIDPELYPALRLQASLSGLARLDRWSVTVNDRFEWRFNNPNDTAGWRAGDFDTTPILGQTDGVLRFEASANSIDPHLLYTFPQPIAAERFRRVEITLRTERDWRTETVTLMWENNFGEFDPSRSLLANEVFLLNYATVAFDLEVERPPGTAWEGSIEAIRIDPVAQFLDPFGEVEGGVVEIESIAIY